MHRAGRSAYAAELIGTFLLVLFVVLVVTVYSEGGLGTTDMAVIGLVHAFLLLMIIASIGGTSGAHINPAVTIALASIRKIAPVDAAIYVAMQLAGAVLAVLVAQVVIQDGSADAVNLGALAISQNFLDGKAAAGFFAELIGTFVLMWAIMGAAVNPSADKSWAPFVIGATLGFLIMVLGPLSGGGLNPARAIAPALVASEFGEAGRFVLVYVVGPIVGAVAAVAAYNAVVLSHRPSPRPIDTLGSANPDPALASRPGRDRKG